MADNSATLQNVFKVNKLNLTSQQTNQINNYISTSQDLFTQFETVILDIIKEFSITVIPS